MIRGIRSTGTSIALGIGAALLASAPAHASVYALSHLNVSNISITLTGATASLDSHTLNLTGSATNGTTASASAACNSFGLPACSQSSPVLDVAAVNAANSAQLRTNNNFGFLGFAGSGPYANSDGVVRTAAEVQGLPTSAEAIAETFLVGDGVASSLNTMTRGGNFTVTPTTGPNVLTFTFSADPDLETRNAGNGGSTVSAQADLVFTFTFTNLANGQSATWTPNGTSAVNDCVSTLAGSTCFETLDSQSLNTHLLTTADDATGLASFDTGTNLTNFGLSIANLAAGTYSLSYTFTTSTSISRIAGTAAVPEPGTLPLVGIALAGAIAFARRRRSR